jgi:hypothetical protein
MSSYVDWIGAQGDDGDPAENALSMGQPVESQTDQQSISESSPGSAFWQKLPAHSFPGQPPEPGDAQLNDDPLDRNPDLCMYRKRTVSLLRRYVRFSLETGRLPSFIGREFFRVKVSYYTAATFEDRVILVRDVEKSLGRLEYWDQQLIVRIILQEHSQEQTARILHWGLRTIERRLPQVLDLLSEDFLRVGLLAEASKGGSSR